MSTEYDVIIIGGAFSGSSEGILLKRARPETRVLIVETQTAFTLHGGESTSAVAGCFLTRVLRQHSWLARHQLPQHGLRFWFNSPENEPANDDVRRCGEIGPYHQAHLPTFHLDRATVDEHLLEEARAAGCEVWRPAKVKAVDLGGAGKNTLDIERDGSLISVQAAWVIDASGRAAVLARKMGTLRHLEEHTTRSISARFRGVTDLDGWEAGHILGKEAILALPMARMMATNHLCGYGWCCWLIPLKNGEMSVGLIWDTRLFTPPAGNSMGAQLQAHLMAHPLGRLMFAQAEPLEQEPPACAQPACFNEQAAGDGWACLGDAAGFVDPLYSQGLDACAYTAYAVRSLVLKSLQGHEVKKEAQQYAINYRKSYHRWYRALYKGKYEYMGDLELMWAATLLDLGTYFTGPVHSVYHRTDHAFSKLPHLGLRGLFFGWWMGLSHRRLAAIARRRMAAGVYGCRNLDQRKLIQPDFTPGPAAVKIIWAGLQQWLKLELHAWFLKPRPDHKPTIPALKRVAPPTPTSSTPTSTADPT